MKLHLPVTLRSALLACLIGGAVVGNCAFAEISYTGTLPSSGYTEPNIKTASGKVTAPNATQAYDGVAWTIDGSSVLNINNGSGNAGAATAGQVNDYGDITLQDTAKLNLWMWTSSVVNMSDSDKVTLASTVNLQGNSSIVVEDGSYVFDKIVVGKAAEGENEAEAGNGTFSYKWSKGFVIKNLSSAADGSTFTIQRTSSSDKNATVFGINGGTFNGTLNIRNESDADKSGVILYVVANNANTLANTIVDVGTNSTSGKRSHLSLNQATVNIKGLSGYGVVDIASQTTLGSSSGYTALSAATLAISNSLTDSDALPSFSGTINNAELELFAGRQELSGATVNSLLTVNENAVLVLSGANKLLGGIDNSGIISFNSGATMQFADKGAYSDTPYNVGKLQQAGVNIADGTDVSALMGNLYARQSAIYNATTGTISISGYAGVLDLTWNGTATRHNWTTQDSYVWHSNSSQEHFLKGDNVTFDSSAEHKTVIINSDIEAGNISIQDDYTFEVTANSTLSGTFSTAADATLTKTGPSTLTLNNKGSITHLEVSAGTLNLNHAGGSIGTLTTQAGAITNLQNASVAITQLDIKGAVYFNTSSSAYENIGATHIYNGGTLYITKSGSSFTCADITIDGGGTLIADNASNWSNAIGTSAGTLRIDATSERAAVFKGTLYGTAYINSTIMGTGTLELNRNKGTNEVRVAGNILDGTNEGDKLALKVVNGSNYNISGSDKQYTYSGGVTVAGGNLTINAVDGLGLGKVEVDSGKLTVNKANSYTGGTSITGGTVTLGAEGSLGSGHIHMTGGTLKASQNTSSAIAAIEGRKVELLGGTLDTADNAWKLEGLELTLGSVTLSGANNLSISGAALAGTITNNLGTGATFTLSGALSIESLAGFAEKTAANSYSEVDNGYQSGGEIWLTQGSNTNVDYSGATLTGGTLATDETTGHLYIAVAANDSGDFFVNTDMDYDSASSESALAGPGTTTVVLNGGKLTMVTGLHETAAANGGIALHTDGNIELGSAVTLSSANVQRNGHALTLSGTGTYSIVSTEHVTVSESLTGGIAVTYSGEGEKTISITQSYTGGTTISGGTVVASAAKSLGTGNVVIDGGMLKVTHGGNTSFVTGTIAVNKGATLWVTATDALGWGDGNRAGNITLTGEKDSVATFRIGDGVGANGEGSYPDRQTLEQTLTLDGYSSVIGTGCLEANGGKIVVNNGDNLLAVNISQRESLTMEINGNLTMTGNFMRRQSGDSGKVTKTGNGTLTLNSGVGTSNLDKGFEVSAGKVINNRELSINALNVASGATFTNNGTLSLSGNTAFGDNFSNSGTLNLNEPDYAYNGTIALTGGLIVLAKNNLQGTITVSGADNVIEGNASGGSALISTITSAVVDDVEQEATVTLRSDETFHVYSPVQHKGDLNIEGMGTVNLGGSWDAHKNKANFQNKGDINIQGEETLRVSLAEAATLNNTGNVNVISGKFSVNSGSSFTTGTLSVSGGSMTANAALTIADLAVTGGSLTLNSGSSLVAAGADFDLSVSGTGKLVVSSLSVLGDASTSYSEGTNGYKQAVYTLISGLTGTTTVSGNVTVGTAENAPSYTLATSGNSIVFTINQGDSYYVRENTTAGGSATTFGAAAKVYVTNNSTLTYSDTTGTGAAGDCAIALTLNNGTVYMNHHSIANTASLTLDGGNNTLRGVEMSLYPGVSGTGNLTMQSEGTFLVKSAVNHTGTLTIDGSGTNKQVTFQDGGSIGTAVTSVTVNNTGVLRLTQASKVASDKSITVNNGKLSLGADYTLNNLSLNGGQVQIDDNINLQGSIYLTGGSNTISGGASELHSGVSGTGSLTVNGGTGNNLFGLRSESINHAGSLELTGKQELGYKDDKGSRKTVVGSKVTAVTVAAGAEVKLTNTSEINNSGTTNVNGSLELANGTKVASTGGINVNGTGELKVNTGATIDSVVNAGKLTIGKGATYSNVSVTASSMTSLEAAEVLLTNESLEGDATPNMGEIFDATLAFTGAYALSDVELTDVAFTATEAANLTNSNVTLAGINTLTLHGDYSLSNGIMSTNVLSGMTLTGSITIDFSSALISYVEQNLGANTLTIHLGTVALPETMASALTGEPIQVSEALTNAFGDASIVQDESGGNISIAFAGKETGAIPEPTTATLSLLALAGLAARRRRK